MQLFAFLLFPSLALSLSMSKEPSPCRSPQTIKSQSNSFLVLFGPDYWKRFVLVVVGIYIFFVADEYWRQKNPIKNTTNFWGFRISSAVLWYVLCSLFRAKSFPQLFVSTMAPQTLHTFCSTNMKALNKSWFNWCRCLSKGRFPRLCTFFAPETMTHVQLGISLDWRYVLLKEHSVFLLL